MAENENESSGNWVMVDSPDEKPTAEQSAASQPEPESTPTEPEPEPQPETVPEPEPEPEQPAEPEPEPEQPAEPEPEPEQPAEPEPEPEQPAEPEPEPEQPAEPEPEPEQPAEPEPEPEPEQPAEPEPEPEPEQPAEPETEPEQPAEPEPEPEPEQPAEPTASEPAPEQPKSEQKEPEPAEEDKPKTSEDDKPAEEGDVTVEVEVEVGGDATMEEQPKEEVVPEPGEEIQIGTYLQLCQVGSDMIKVKKSKGFPRHYRLEKDLLSIAWNSKSKPANKARIPISNIKEVRAGRSTDSFKVSKDTHLEEVCFSVIYVDGNNFKTLDLAALTVSDRTSWVEALKALLKVGARDGEDVRSKVRERWLKDLFDEADKDGSGSLDLKEVQSMMHRLNVGVSSKQMKRKFKKADDSTTEGGQTDGKLNFSEFCSLFKELATRPELQLLFNKYSSRMEWLTVKDLQKFLQLEQGADNPSLEFCTQLIQKYEPTDEGKAQGWLSLDGFSQFMLGPENDIINVDRSSHIHQDMSQPLSHYYIASSHNTYLLEDQLKGPSSCEAYIRALRKGCRCVELDCWDGPDGEPIIYHGHTLTSKILFKDAIEAVKEHAFAVSAYPVILSIENHCSIPQQHRMAEMMKDILGDLLYDQERDESREVLPSPEELKRKILVKGKKLKKEQEEAEDDDGEVTDEDEAGEIDEAQLGKVKPQEEAKPAEDKPAEDKPAEDKPAEDKPAEDKPAEDKPAEDKPAEDKPAEDKPAEDKPAEDKPAEDKPAEDKPAGAEGGAETQGAAASPRKARSKSFRSRQRKATVTEKPKKKIKLSAKLSKCINYVQSVHFPGIEGHDGVTHVSAKCWEMSSFGESTASKLSKENAVKYVTYNKRQVSRTYPKGSRVDSSNYDPTPMWNTGCQIVALNYQTPGKAMDLNEGKFRDNGGCGYILKPAIMREELSRFDHNQRNVHYSGFGPKIITLRVISGQQLPKPGDKKGEVIDPYVVVQLVGADSDSRRFKTKTISDNGFNPVWKDSPFQMLVKYPELAVLRIKVMDEDWGPNPDDFIGSYALPVDCLVPGYRHVHLYKSGNKLETGSLFVHVQIQDYVAPHRSFGKTKTFLRIKKSREYPEQHQVGHQSIDVHFRNVLGPLHRAVDLREDYVFSLLHLKELVGHGPQASLGDCVELLAARARSAGVSIHLEQSGESEDTKVYRVGVAREEGAATAVPVSLQQMFDAFNILNSAIQALLQQAPPTVNELESIAKEAREQEGALRQHLKESPVPPKRPDLVVDHFARTIFTVTTEASQLAATKDQAVDTLNKLFSASKGAGIDLKSSS